jgi:hypothetical protein
MNPWRVFYKISADQQPPYPFEYITAVSEAHAIGLFKNMLGHENLIVVCARPV